MVKSSFFTRSQTASSRKVLKLKPHRSSVIARNRLNAVQEPADSSKTSDMSQAPHALLIHLVSLVASEREPTHKNISSYWLWTQQFEWSLTCIWLWLCWLDRFNQISCATALCRFLCRRLSIGKFKLQVSFSLGSFVSDKNIWNALSISLLYLGASWLQAHKPANLQKNQ